MTDSVPAWATRAVRELTSCAAFAANEAKRRVADAIAVLTPTSQGDYPPPSLTQVQASEVRALLEGARAGLDIAAALGQRAQDAADEAMRLPPRDP